MNNYNKISIELQKDLTEIDRELKALDAYINAKTTTTRKTGLRKNVLEAVTNADTALVKSKKITKDDTGIYRSA